MLQHLQWLMVLVLFCCLPGIGYSQRAKLAKEAAEYMLAKFGVSATREGTEVLSKRLATYAARYGDDFFVAARKVGPQTFHLADSAGAKATQAVRLLAKEGETAATLVLTRPTAMKLFTEYGEQCATALIKHPQVAEPLLANCTSHAAPLAVQAMNQMTSQSTRRLAMLAEKELAEPLKKPELWKVLARYGDAGCDFVFRNKGALTVGTSLALFISDPEPFIHGVKDLSIGIANAAGESLVKPLAQVPAEAVRTIGNNTNWTLVFTLALTVFSLLTGYNFWRRHHHPSKPSGTAP